ncbi:MAG: phosphate transport regulator, partial [Mesorhizobium sp.]
MTLEALGSRIVFLIDWNRARKRLRLLVGKANATAILAASARRDIGHMGWLEAGAEHLLFDAMESIGSEFFRIGDRLDTVL